MGPQTKPQCRRKRRLRKDELSFRTVGFSALSKRCQCHQQRDSAAGAEAWRGDLDLGTNAMWVVGEAKSITETAVVSQLSEHFSSARLCGKS